jgi:hypothetical protein
MAVLSAPVPVEPVPIDLVVRILQAGFRHRASDVAVEEWREGRGSGNLSARRRLIRHVPYRNIYGSDPHSDFVFIDGNSGMLSACNDGDITLD